ncbi:glycoside hydrolase family 71 protein [Streptomyces sp. TRM49041]|uniref:glycoside hydrolase family 71 protein n=1 Tax=Streptomyces sp. TRM49041 TaxID=2603216 RepID=UPI0021CD1261|nr:glycoside hydrolase family 71 protein [Streptomyces sp. TRM49041]
MAGLLLTGVCATLATAWGGRTSGAGAGDATQAAASPVPHGVGGLRREGPPRPSAEPSGAGSGVPSAPAPVKSPGDADTAGKGAGRSQASAALPFDMPDRATLRASGKLVFAHYFTPFPLSLDNAPAADDYYARNYLTPDGERGKHQAYGGLLRDRPLPVRPKVGDWELANLQQEVRTARDAGLDGFTLDILSLSGKNRERCELLLKAARTVDPTFKIMLMPDMSSLRTGDPKELADALAELGRYPSAHRLDDGRLVVAPFKAEAKSVRWWSGVIDDLRARHGVRTAFVPLFLDFGSHDGSFAAISHGFSDWGSRSYTGREKGSRDARRAHDMGKIWMQPVSVQDARPNQGTYHEAGNTATLRATWTRAIEGEADWVQLTTWNDYSEGTHFAPSQHNGHAYLDLMSYYLTRFKTGAWPKIVRDTLYVTSRTQFADTVPTSSQSRLMSLREGSADARDTVEVLAFLPRPATVRATVGRTTSSHKAPAGMNTVLLPLRPGAVSARAVRGDRVDATVTLPYRVRHTVEVQDLQYYAATSGRRGPG